METEQIHVVFDGPPSEPGRFVEVEDASGRSIRVGRWIQVGELWSLVLEVPTSTIEGRA